MTKFSIKQKLKMIKIDIKNKEKYNNLAGTALMLSLTGICFGLHYYVEAKELKECKLTVDKIEDIANDIFENEDNKLKSLKLYTKEYKSFFEVNFENEDGKINFSTYNIVNEDFEKLANVICEDGKNNQEILNETGVVVFAKELKEKNIKDAKMCCEIVFDFMKTYLPQKQSLNAENGNFSLDFSSLEMM